MKKTLITSAILVILAACSSNKKAAATAPAAPPVDPVAVGAQKFPGYTQAEYEIGKSMYESNCGNCHKLHKPASLDEPQWRHEVADMAPKVNSKAGSQVIGVADQELIVRYLVSAGTAARQSK